MLCHYIAAYVHRSSTSGTNNVASFGYEISDIIHNGNSDFVYHKCDKAIVCNSGTGWFKDADGNDYYAMFQYVGTPVGTNCCAEQLSRLIVFTKDVASLALFIQVLSKDWSNANHGEFISFRWVPTNQHWVESSSEQAKDMKTMILPHQIKDDFIHDMQEFFAAETSQFYTYHGIPYKRVYLLHGMPGTGKTSLIRAAAGLFKKNLYIMQLSLPRISDDDLRLAIANHSNGGIVVLEDIDMIFDKNRINMVNNSKITFGGLLNALDGICTAKGSVIVLTTNYIDRLDPALIRKGRVDVRVEFTYADEEQVLQIWNQYHPCSYLEHRFYDIVKSHRVTTCELQDFFAMNRKLTAFETLMKARDHFSNIDVDDCKTTDRVASPKRVTPLFYIMATMFFCFILNIVIRQ